MKIKGFRTLALNVGAALVAVFQDNIGVAIDPSWGIPALAVVNMVLRVFTNTPVGKNEPVLQAGQR